MTLVSTVSRAIVPFLFQRLMDAPSDGWVLDVAGDVLRSDQPRETFVGLGSVAPMEKWDGAREERELVAFDHPIENDTFQTSLVVRKRERMYDHTQQIERRIDDLTGRYGQHWNKLAAKALDVGTLAGSLCYDGQPFFSTTHNDGRGEPDQSNLLNVGAPSGAAPTKDEMHDAIFRALGTFVALKDDLGEPRNEDQRSFVLLYPPHMMQAVAGAIGSPMLEGGTSNDLVAMGGYTFRPRAEPRLSLAGTQDWTLSFALLSTDGRALARMEVEGPNITSKAEGSDYEHDTGNHSYGVDATRGLGYAAWQSAMRINFAA